MALLASGTQYCAHNGAANERQKIARQYSEFVENYIKNMFDDNEFYQKLSSIKNNSHANNVHGVGAQRKCSK